MYPSKPLSVVDQNWPRLWAFHSEGSCCREQCCGGSGDSFFFFLNIFSEFSFSWVALVLIVLIRFLYWGLVSGGPDSPAAKIKDICSWACWGNCSSLHCINPGVSDSRGAGAGWECKQRLEGEEDHSKASAAGHQRRWGAGHPDQRHHCWRWCHPPHSQVSH